MLRKRGTSEDKEKMAGGDKKISIESWLTGNIILIMGLAILLIAGFLILSSLKNSKMVIKEVQAYMEDDVKNEIIKTLELAEQLNSTNYNMLKSGVLDIESRESREKYFTNIIRTYPDAAMSFIGLEDGRFYGARRNLDGEIYVARNDSTTDGGSFYYSIDEEGMAINLEEEHPDFDPRTRSWYRTAAEKGQASYSDIYIHFVFQEATITASSPIYDDSGHLVGVFGVNYLLSWVDGLLDKLLIGENGKIFITDANDMLLSTNIDLEDYRQNEGMGQEDIVELINIHDIDNDYIKRTRDKLNEKSTIKKPTIRVDGRKYNIGVFDLNKSKSNVDWKIHFLVAENDFMKDIKVSIMYTLAFLIVFIILTVILLNWLSKEITSPIEKISKASEELASGSVDEIKNENRIEELYKLTDSFNEMSYRLSDMLTSLEDEISKRTYELECTNRELEILSFKDGLTGIYNRRKFDEFYTSAWEVAVESNRQLGVLMLDIDFFKKYNDIYGHLKGDECLKIIASSLRSSTRRGGDLLARYGGEEFIVFVQEIRKEDLINLAERIRRDIEALKIEHLGSSFKIVTISIGVASMKADRNISSRELIRRSDLALYEAKEAGRNKVSVYENIIV